MTRTRMTQEEAEQAAADYSNRPKLLDLARKPRQQVPATDPRPIMEQIRGK